jgi:hypothetical protein
MCSGPLIWSSLCISLQTGCDGCTLSPGANLAVGRESGAPYRRCHCESPTEALPKILRRKKRKGELEVEEEEAAPLASYS